MMEEKGVPIYSIVFLFALFMCCFGCIGCCVWMCKKRKASKQVEDSATEHVENEGLENVIVHEITPNDSNDDKKDEQKQNIYTNSGVGLQDQQTTDKLKEEDQARDNLAAEGGDAIKVVQQQT